MAAEIVYEPDPKHKCTTDIHSGEKPYGTVVSCLECGQYWFVGWTLEYEDCKKWRKLRWYHYKLRKYV